jgi:hypothetical protein
MRQPRFDEKIAIRLLPGQQRAARDVLETRRHATSVFCGVQ